MSKSTPDNTLEIYKGPDGAFFAIPYRAATARMRNEASDPASVALLAFKIHGSGSGRFLAIAEAVRDHFKADCIIAVPSASTALNSVQLIVEDETPLILRPRFARPNRHNQKESLTRESETLRIALDWQTEAKKIPRVLLLDDVARTGETLAAFAEMLIKEGVASEVIRFSFGRAQCRFTRAATLHFSPRPDLPALSGAIAGRDDGPRSEGLERLRQLRGDLVELELAQRQGELINRDSVHVAFASVVAVVQTDLLSLAGWGAIELASLGPEEIEQRLDKRARAIADGFQKKCGDVRLLPPELAKAKLHTIMRALAEEPAPSSTTTTKPTKRSRKSSSKRKPSHART